MSSIERFFSGFCTHRPNSRCRLHVATHGYTRPPTRGPYTKRQKSYASELRKTGSWRERRFTLLRACVLFHLSRSWSTRNRSGHLYSEQAPLGLSAASNVCPPDRAILLRRSLHAPGWAITSPVKRPTLRQEEPSSSDHLFLFGHHLFLEGSTMPSRGRGSTTVKQLTGVKRVSRS